MGNVFVRLFNVPDFTYSLANTLAEPQRLASRKNLFHIIRYS